MEINIKDYGQKAFDLFCEGYNCAQAVFCAFCDLTGYDLETAAKISSSFGGGIGRLREVCGTVSGAEMVLGCLYGYTDLEDMTLKSDHYKRVRAMAYAFEKLNGSYICRDVLKLKANERGGEPAPRDAKFKHERPCYEFVRQSAEICAKIISLDGKVDEETDLLS